MKIATWNVNSVRARLEAMATWLEEAQPDVLLLQEIKCVDEAFPTAFFEDRGYACATLGQKSYNGVAILSKLRLEDVTRGLETFPEDSAARYIDTLVGGRLRVVSLYIPNGGVIVGAEPYRYKLEFLRRLQAHLEQRQTFEEATLVGGDYNIAPDDLDVYDAKIWHDRVCCTREEREMLRAWRALGYRDLIQEAFDREPDQAVTHRPFTWWDYRRRTAFPQNQGLRLDHFFANEVAASWVQRVTVERSVRALPRPSDHAPVVCEVKI